MKADIVLIRHGIAEDNSPEGPDSYRRLTEEGRQRFGRQVVSLKARGMKIDTVLHSPWTRAVQTAELLKPIVSGDLVSTDALTQMPGDELWLQMQEYSGQCLALVGHNPYMSYTLSFLLTGDPQTMVPVFKKGALALLRGRASPGSCHLEGFLPPKALI